MTRTAKMLLGLATLAGLALLIQLFIFIDSHKQVEVISTQNDYAYSVQREIDNLYISPNSSYIIADIEESDIQAINNHLLNLEEEGGLSVHLIKEYNNLLRRFVAVREVNQMYQTDVIQGDRIQINTPFVKDLSKESVLQAYPLIIYDNEEDSLHQSLQTQMDYIMGQVEAYEKVVKELEDLYYIPLEVANYSLIAKAMAEAEEAYTQINNPSFLEELDAFFQAFAQDFVDSLKQANEEGLDYSLLQETVSSSKYLVRIIQGLSGQGELND